VRAGRDARLIFLDVISSRAPGHESGCTLPVLKRPPPRSLRRSDFLKTIELAMWGRPWTVGPTMDDRSARTRSPAAIAPGRRASSISRRPRLGARRWRHGGHGGGRWRISWRSPGYASTRVSSAPDRDPLKTGAQIPRSRGFHDLHSLCYRHENCSRSGHADPRSPHPHVRQ
jgi:hypothetical protein